MSGTTEERMRALADPGKSDGPELPSASSPKSGRRVFHLSGEEPAEAQDPRIDEDPSTVISFRDSAYPFAGKSPTETATRPPDAEIEMRRDRERLMALQLLNLEWSSLPYELQRAVILMLHDLAKERRG
jgi:hypothetical protein